MIGGLEGLLDEGGLGGELGLQGEDPRNRLGVLGVVEAPAAPLGDVHHQLHVGILADGDGGDRDLVLGHAPQEAGEVAARHLAVGQEDHVLEQRRPIEENGVGLLERRIAVGASARLDGGHGVVDRRPVAGRLDREVPDELGVPAHHPDLVAVVEEVHDEVGGFLGQVELGDLLVGGHRHRARAVDREHDGQAGDLDLLLHLHGDGQRFLDRRPVVAAETEALLAADHDEPAAVVADVVADAAPSGLR